MTARRLLLPVTWSILLLVGVAFESFLRGQQHERKHWAEALGACDLPATQLDTLVIMRSPSGALYCQPRRR